MVPDIHLAPLGKMQTRKDDVIAKYALCVCAIDVCAAKTITNSNTTHSYYRTLYELCTNRGNLHLVIQIPANVCTHVCGRLCRLVRHPPSEGTVSDSYSPRSSHGHHGEPAIIDSDKNASPSTPFPITSLLAMVRSSGTPAGHPRLAFFVSYLLSPHFIWNGCLFLVQIATSTAVFHSWETT